MSPDQQKVLMRRFIEEVWNTGNLAFADEVLADGYVNHDPSTPRGIVRGAAAMKQLVSAYRTAFPDLHFTIEQQIAENDYVVSCWRSTGTHRGELLGLAPTGIKGNVTGITVSRLVDGRIVEERVNWDTLGLLKQLGAK